MALFFVSLGAPVDPQMLLGNLPLLGTILGLIVVVKFVVWGRVVWAHRGSLRGGAVFVILAEVVG